MICMYVFVDQDDPTSAVDDVHIKMKLFTWDSLFGQVFGSCYID